MLSGVNLSLNRGSRCILTGDNGAGKTTLLRILGGRHLTDPGTVVVLGKVNAFDTSLNLTRSLVESNWASRSMAFTAYKVPLEADIPVKELSVELHKEFSDRWDKLCQILDINLEWKMHQVSDGQRRRVQLLLSLLRPFEVLLLDEVTTDLDVVTRSDFLSFLREETETRGVTIVYATHIFDGLEEWATHLVYMNQGKVRVSAQMTEIAELKEFRAKGSASALMRTIELFIRQDRKRIYDEKQARKAAGEDVDKTEKKLFKPDGSAGGFRAGRMVNHWG
jgi:CCR4-NOT complex subunit CAF16